jgi:hypothetical protein
VHHILCTLDTAANALLLFAVVQVAVDFSETRHCWCDMIRVWALHASHERYDRSLAQRNNNTLATIIASHRRSLQVRQRLKLQQVGGSLPAAA